MASALHTLIMTSSGALSYESWMPPIDAAMRTSVSRSLDGRTGGHSDNVGLPRRARRPDSVSAACRVMGSRFDSGYRFRSRYESGGEAAVLAFTLEQPAYGQVCVSNALLRRGHGVSAARSDNLAAHAKIGTEHSTYIGAPDTYHFGTRKDVGELTRSLHRHVWQDGNGV